MQRLPCLGGAWRRRGRDGGGKDTGKTRIEGGQVGYSLFFCALYFFSTLCVPGAYTHWIRSSRYTETCDVKFVPEVVGYIEAEVAPLSEVRGRITRFT